MHEVKMKTRINLYLEELKPKREFLVLKNVVLSWGALIFVLTCSASVLGYFYYSSKQQVSTLQVQLDKTKYDLTQAQQALERKQDKTPLLRRIDIKKQEVLEKKRLLGVMETKTEQAQFDYAQVMIDLAKNRHSELWLTQFKFIGDNITLAGQATHGSAIPIWLNGLKNTDYFSAKTFS